MQYNKQKPTSTTLELAAAPADEALERAVLGACLLDSQALQIVQDILTTPDAFYNLQHQAIYSCMLQMASAGIPVDLLTTTQQLRIYEAKNPGVKVEPFYLVEVANMVASSANLETHARVVKQFHVQRQVGMFAMRMYSEAHQGHTDVFDLLGACEAGLMDITKGLPGTSAESLASLASQLVKQTEETMLASQRGEFTGVPSGIPDLDRATGGWQPGQLIVLAARPGMGKTSFAVGNLALYPATLDIPVGILSLEMTKMALTARLAAPVAGLTTTQLRSGQLAEDDLRRLVEACETVGRYPIYIDDEGGISISKVRAKARHMVRKYGIKMLVIDYLQLITGSSSGSENRNQEITQITMALKALAKELQIPIVALSQLSRDVERRADKRPILADLRESGSIEQDSDDVLFLYRPAYYDATADDTTELISAKRRDGKLGTTFIKFVPAATRFVLAEDVERSSALFSGRQVPGVVDFSKPRYESPLDIFESQTQSSFTMPRQEPDTFPF